MVGANGGELVDQPRHQVDANHCDLARGRGSEERAPALRAPVEDGDAKMLQVRPGRDLLRPYGRGDELRRDNEAVPALAVTDQLGERRERSSTLAGTERRDQHSGVALVEPGCGALLVRTQDAREEGGVHRSAALLFV
jgi:hypothetical protein